MLARRTGVSTSPLDKHLHCDHIGNVMAETNASGAVIAEHQYDAYGRPVLSSASGGWEDNSLHHTTKGWDGDLGMFYFNARWFDAQVGVFIS